MSEGRPVPLPDLPRFSSDLLRQRASLRRALSLLLLSFLVLALPLLAAGCGEGAEEVDPAERTISREAFVSAYVDLRMAALRNPDSGITPEARERILDAHGITPEDLLHFVEVHGSRDPEMIQDVWTEVQDRIRQAREDAVTEDGSDASPDDGDGEDAEDAGDAGAPQRAPGSTIPMLRAS